MKRGPIDIRKRKNQFRRLQRKINEFINIQQWSNDQSNNDRMTINLNTSCLSMTIVWCGNLESECYPTVCSGQQACESVSVVLETLDTTTQWLAARIQSTTTIATTTTQSTRYITSTTVRGYSLMMNDSGTITRYTEGSGSSSAGGNGNENGNGTSDNKFDVEEFVSRLNKQTVTVKLIVGLSAISFTFMFSLHPMKLTTTYTITIMITIMVKIESHAFGHRVKYILKQQLKMVVNNQ